MADRRLLEGDESIREEEEEGNADGSRLKQLGYKQELSRSLSYVPIALFLCLSHLMNSALASLIISRV
ncbi:hypothetical protein B296_00049004 [Ensete ventricosum]|uniref:Uncharacterized protein n=1 Tax=Ensete ventricosum TaxID=4639 RepID=A0A426Y9P6_ENSVE|nr:hypothetical protein B296_00049004 [Ensete ventricosum]